MGWASPGRRRSSPAIATATGAVPVPAASIAIVAETILGEGGIVPLEERFLAAIRETATERDALWIADETQCGLGRTGERFAYQRFGLRADG